MTRLGGGLCVLPRRQGVGSAATPAPGGVPNRIRRCTSNSVLEKAFRLFQLWVGKKKIANLLGLYANDVHSPAGELSLVCISQFFNRLLESRVRAGRALEPVDPNGRRLSDPDGLRAERLDRRPLGGGRPTVPADPTLPTPPGHAGPACDHPGGERRLDDSPAWPRVDGAVKIPDMRNRCGRTHLP